MKVRCYFLILKHNLKRCITKLTSINVHLLYEIDEKVGLACKKRVCFSAKNCNKNPFPTFAEYIFIRGKNTRVH